MTFRTDWGVSIGGRNVTQNMRAYLTRIEVDDKDGTASDTCMLEFADTDGVLLLPPVKSPIAVTLNGIEVFAGFVDSTPWSISRGGGRTLTVSAKGIDTREKLKEKQRWHLDDATLQDALDKAAKRAGLSGIVVSPAIASSFRDYWSPDGQSFLAWGQAIAREYGATFKIRGDRAVIARRGDGESATGVVLPTVIGEVGRNVISANIDPTKGRARFKTKRVRFFDRESATFKEREVQVTDEGEGASDAIDEQRWSAADEGQAASAGEGGATEAERGGGVGRVEIGCEPTAQAEGTFVLIGARPGIDGTYRITGVSHRVDRSGGSTTSLELAQPQGGAGRDTRAAE